MDPTAGSMALTPFAAPSRSSTRRPSALPSAPKRAPFERRDLQNQDRAHRAWAGAGAFLGTGCARASRSARRSLQAPKDEQPPLDLEDLPDDPVEEPSAVPEETTGTGPSTDAAEPEVSPEMPSAEPSTHTEDERSDPSEASTAAEEEPVTDGVASDREDLREIPFAEANPMSAEEASPSEELSDTEAFLLEEVGLTQKQMRKIRTFWSYSGERLPPLGRCQMVADYFQNDVGLNEEQLRRTIADCPEALEVFSVETLKEKVRFLEVEVGVDEPDLPEVVAAYPQVFTRPILTTLRPALEFWMGAAGIDPEELPELLKKHAAQMWMRPEALKLKLRFAKEVMGLSLKQVLACAAPFFRLSMEKTVAPRHFFSIQRKVTGLTLEDMVGGSDAAFCKKIDAKPSEYKEFLEEWPFSEQARALAWLQPPKKKRFRSNWSGPSKPSKFKRRNFQKKRKFRKQRDDEPRSEVDKSQSRARRPRRQRPDFDEGRFEADRSDLFSRAEL